MPMTIVVSADVQPQAQERVRQLGASGFVPKTVNHAIPGAIHPPSYRLCSFPLRTVMTDMASAAVAVLGLLT